MHEWCPQQLWLQSALAIEKRCHYGWPGNLGGNAVATELSGLYLETRVGRGLR